MSGVDIEAAADALLLLKPPISSLANASRISSWLALPTAKTCGTNHALSGTRQPVFGVPPVCQAHKKCRAHKHVDTPAHKLQQGNGTCRTARVRMRSCSLWDPLLETSAR